MPSFMQICFPCFAGSDEDTQPPSHHHDHAPAKQLHERARSPSNASTYAAKIPVSEGPGAQQSPGNRPDFDKKLPPRPGSRSGAIELPGSAAPDFHEMPAPHVPEANPLARPSNATSTDFRRPSQQSERNPLSPFSAPSILAGGSVAGSTYQRSGSVRAPSEHDPDEITPVATNSSSMTGGRPNMYHNVTDALTDRKRMFERLRKANVTEQQSGADGAQEQGRGTAESVRSVPGTSHSLRTATPVEMEAPVRQHQAPSELAAVREQARYSNTPRELE